MPTTRDTPARRARARRDPALRQAPFPPRVESRSTLRNLHIRIAGQSYLLGPAIEGDPEMAATIDGAATISMAVRDVDGTLQEALSDEAQLMETGATIVVNGTVYVLQSTDWDGSGTGGTLIFEDQAAWRLRQFTRFLVVSRARSTFAQFVKRLVDEASAAPLERLPFFCPEINDKQRIAKPEPLERADTAGRAGRSRGTGTSAITVKGKRATARQRDVIDGCLQEAQRLGASRRVMIATVMCVTQESVAGESTGQTGNDDVGLFQQGRNWISAADAARPGPATRAFLTGAINGGGAPGWKQLHGSVKTAPGDLEAAIKRVQVSVGGYKQWEAEATKTVDAFLGGATTGASSASSGGVFAEPYEFVRGDKENGREDSWACIGRYAVERNWRRWAAQNTLWLVSDEELRAAAPSLTIHGDEPFLLEQPAGEWSPNRPENEVTIRVLASRWGVQIGASVLLATGSQTRGRFLVAETRGNMVAPELDVVLRRPAPKKLEPAHTLRERAAASERSDGVGSGVGSRGSSGGTWKLGGGANRPGVELTRALKMFLDRMATFYSGTLVVSTGTNHSQYTTSGNVSDHWEGNGADFGMVANGGTNNGPVGDRIATAAWRAAGLSFADAMRRARTGGAQDVTVSGMRVQVIWKNFPAHDNHVHVGIKR